eukprot:8553532-Ditylum_brightwellii.AAC.1
MSRREVQQKLVLYMCEWKKVAMGGLRVGQHVVFYIIGGKTSTHCNRKSSIVPSSLRKECVTVTCTNQMTVRTEQT